MSARRRSSLIHGLVLLALGCAAQPAAAQTLDSVRIAVTTSVADSGLLDHLVPLVEERLGLQVFAQSLPTDMAVNLGEAGRVELVIGIRSRGASARTDRKGTVRATSLMSNEFLLVGPPDDPVGLRSAASMPAALREIARQRVPYVSRADNSGTHAVEREFWAEAGINPKARAGNWFVETGLSMGRSLAIASSMGAHILVDRATWLSRRTNTAARLTVLVAGKSGMRNEYEIMLATAEEEADPNHPAQRLRDWLTGPEGQASIAEFRIHGEVAFLPAGKPED